jgi:hypothetical protein
MMVTIITALIRSSMMSNITIMMMLLVLVMTHHAVESCQGHMECPIDQFCSINQFCENCEYCVDNDPSGPYGQYGNSYTQTYTVLPLDEVCPQQCRCSSHKECSDLQRDSSYPGGEGTFCASYSVTVDWDGNGFNETRSRSSCHSCQFLHDYNFASSAPPGDGAADDDEQQSSSCSSISPCLCASSSDCPHGSYCASDIRLYERYISTASEWGAPVLNFDDDEATALCYGYCVSCFLGCVDDLILNLVPEGTTSEGDDVPPPQDCYGVCPFYDMQCNNTHEDCNFSSDDGYIDTETNWCSVNHRCNSCSIGCAADETWGVQSYNDVFESVDGACPSGCCGWGLSREPLWIPDSVGIIAPCGATPETEILPIYKTYKVDDKLTIEIMLKGDPCPIVEREYLEWAPADEVNSSTVSLSNATMVIRKAVEVHCTELQYLRCSDYPLWVAVLSRPNNSSNYSFIYEPTALNNGSLGYYCTGTTSSTPLNYTKLARTVALYMMVGGLIGLVLIRMGALKRRTNLRSGQASDETIPAAIPVSVFDFIAPPPPKEVKDPLEEPATSDVGSAAKEMPPTGLEGGPSLSSVPEGPLPSASSKVSPCLIEVDSDDEV